MNHIISLGAINKLTGEYVYPKIANKKDDGADNEKTSDFKYPSQFRKNTFDVHHGNT